MRQFLQYWRTYKSATDLGGILRFAASAQFDRIKAGDLLWIVALKERRLTLLGRIVVGKVVSREDAVAELGPQVYDAPLCAIAKAGTEIASVEADVQALAPLLRFNSGQDRLDAYQPEHTDGKQLQALRELTPDSALLLQTALESQTGSAVVGIDDEQTTASRNPKWSRDELMLALDLYFRYPPTTINKNNPAVGELSEILNSLGIRLGHVQNDKFRNPNGVYMKLCNFLRLDPAYHGTGLRGGGKLEEQVWNQFAAKRDDLRRTAQAIRAVVQDDSERLQPFADQEEQEFIEGAVLYRTHVHRERNLELVRKAKERGRTRNGRVNCEACGFDYEAVYGEVGEGYIECHHTVPVSELSPGGKTRLEDIALLCASCHRMVHRRRPWLRMEQLRSLLKLKSN